MLIFLVYLLLHTHIYIYEIYIYISFFFRYRLNLQYIEIKKKSLGHYIQNYYILKYNNIIQRMSIKSKIYYNTFYFHRIKYICDETKKTKIVQYNI